VFYKIISCFSFLVLHFTTFVGYPGFDSKLRVAFIHVLQECTVCQKRRSHLKILVARRVAWIKFRWEAPQILGPTLQNLPLTATWRSGFDPDLFHTNTATSQTAPARLHLNIVSDEHWYKSLSFRTAISGTVLKVKWFVWKAFKILSTLWMKSDKTLDFFITSGRTWYVPTQPLFLNIPYNSSSFYIRFHLSHGTRAGRCGMHTKFSRETWRK